MTLVEWMLVCLGFVSVWLGIGARIIDTPRYALLLLFQNKRTLVGMLIEYLVQLLVFLLKLRHLTL